MITLKLVLLALLAIFMMGFVPVLIYGISANEATIGFVRLAIASAGIGLLMGLQNGFHRINRKELGWLMLLGLTFAVHWYMYFYSIKRAGASLAAIAVCTFGIHLLFVNRLFFKESIRPLDFLAVLIAFIGVWIATPIETGSSTQVFGFIVGVLSGLLYACLPPINRQIAHLSTNYRALGQFGFGLLGFAVIFPMTDWQLSLQDWYGLAMLGVVCTLGAHTLWNKVSTEMPGSFTAVIYYLYIPWAMLLSVVFLKEQVTWQMVLGATLIIFANVLIAVFHNRRKSSE
jgi:drug/metabolite transporter (DMT)-like permease